MKQIIVDGYETNYYITEDGQCYNKKTNKILKGQISNSGYLNYNLTLGNGLKKRYYAHRLVALMYLENPNELPEVNHKDGNKLNNKINNLEWISSSDNIKHSYNIGLNKNANKVYQFDKDLKLVNVYNSIAEAAKNNGSESCIRQELNKNPKSITCGYYWHNKEIADFEIIVTQNTGVKSGVYQMDLNDNIINTYSSMGEAARAVGGTHSHISECCRGKIKTYKGYKWKKFE